MDQGMDIVDERKYELNVITFRPSLRDYFRQRFPDLVVYDLDNHGDDEKPSGTSLTYSV